MLTKQQCLSEELNPQSSAIDLSNPHLRDAIFYAMQLYAKEVSLAFFEFEQGMSPEEMESNFNYFISTIN